MLAASKALTAHIVRRDTGPLFTILQVQTILSLLGCKVWQTGNLLERLFSGRERITITELLYHLPHIVYGAIPNINRFEEKDIHVACSIARKEQPMIILLGGTSGCGKSTIASFLSSKFGISSTISTDTIRHILRTRHTKEMAPFLWTSSYQASDVIALDPTVSDSQERVIKGYKLQSDMILQEIENLIHFYAFVKKESLILEGVHLSMEYCARWMKQYGCVLPFLIYIGKETKHIERFAIRAKYMTLEPHLNKYSKYFDNIRAIQEHLMKEADLFRIPKIDNSNIDRTIALMHKTIFSVFCTQYPRILSISSAILMEEFSKLDIHCPKSSKKALNLIHEKEARKRSSSEGNMKSKSENQDNSSPQRILDFVSPPIGFHTNKPNPYSSRSRWGLNSTPKIALDTVNELQLENNLPSFPPVIFFEEDDVASLGS
jgi:2-phosphoglycerate kinase